MRIALVSYEYEGSRVGGGIGTYIRNAARMLSQHGCAIEVFTAGEQERSVRESDFSVHTVVSSRDDFAHRIAGPFAQRHAAAPFDVIEGPEYNADARVIAREFPAIPLVVRLHAPTFTIQESNALYVHWRARLRFALGAIRRGQFPTDPWRYDPHTDLERLHAREADEVVANSHATARRVSAVWALSEKRLSTVPLVFNQSDQLLHLPPSQGSSTPTILYLGRIEVRKGVIELARAVPKIIMRWPTAQVFFVGRDTPHPSDGRMVSRHIQDLTRRVADRVKIVDGVPHPQIARYLRSADLCVFPSRWEAAGYVCLEAMAAARAIVATNSGGMAELIENGKSGLLVSPGKPAALVEAIHRLLADEPTRVRMGTAARLAVRNFAPEIIAPLQIAAYRRAIANAANRCPGTRFA